MRNVSHVTPDGSAKAVSGTEERGSAADISYWEPGLDLRSSLSFTAKRRSALHQEVPNKGREMETHRNRSLCSHDLIRHDGARLSGSSAACCTNRISDRKLRGCRERGRIAPLSLSELLRHEGALIRDRGRELLSSQFSARASYKDSPLRFSPDSVMCSPLQCLNMVFLLSKYGHLRHGRSI